MKNKQIITKKVWALMMAVVFMFTMLPVFATETNTETEIVLQGNGTPDEPYLIGTEAELLAFREAVHADAANDEATKTSNLCAQLTADITLTQLWDAIAASNKACYYGGTIDGAGHTISNMKAGRKDVFGLVGEGTTGLTFKDLTIEGTLGREDSIHTGGFVGRAHAGITFIDCVNKVNITGTQLLGGFIGNPGSYAHSFTNCANYGNITNTAASTVGGFIGNVGVKATTFTNCANYGDITGTGSAVIAGFAKNGTFTNCIGYGKVNNAAGPATATYHTWGNTESSGQNCYFRKYMVTSGSNQDTTGGTGMLHAQFVSGELTYLLNGSSSENITWGQDLENDKYPVYGKTEYPVYYIEAQNAYSNIDDVIGTETNPYLIGTEAQLKSFRTLTKQDGGTTLCAKLIADIKLTSAWTSDMIGSSTYKYAGTFDGNGYTISGFSITSGDVRGFIKEGGSGLVIKNLTLEGTMSGVNTSAAFIGRANGTTTIENCVNKVNVSGTHTIGGFVGRTASTITIKNSANYGNITATKTDASDSYAGGFIGRADNENSSVTNCANYGNITGLTGKACGLIYKGSATNSYNFGSVSNTGGTAAPITGGTKNGAVGLVANSYYDATKISGTTVLTTYGTNKTAAQFASGEVTYLLNGSTAQDITWGQELGVDQYPVLDKTDYPVYKFGSHYSNEPFGTESNPYLIGTESELKAFRDLVNAGETTLCAKLTADIALTEAWARIGSGSYYYGGTFDGDGHKITNMTANRADVFGLVGEAGAGLVIKNLTLEGTFNYTGAKYTAGFVGRSHGAVTIENCVNKVNVSGTDRVAGFIADGNYAHVFNNCVNEGTITGTTNVSGFLGTQGGDLLATFTNCANYGDITGSNGPSGIAQKGKFKNCIGYGTVTVTDETKLAFPAFNGWGDATQVSKENCYYRTDSLVGSASAITSGTSKTADQFASGEVAYLLNKGANEIICGQDLTADSHPVFGKDSMVYYNLGSYSNETGVFLSADADNALAVATGAAIGYVAQYDADHRLVDVQPITVTQELQNYPITAATGAAYAKVFLWDNGMKPLCSNEKVDF